MGFYVSPDDRNSGICDEDDDGACCECVAASREELRPAYVEGDAGDDEQDGVDEGPLTKLPP